MRFPSAKFSPRKYGTSGVAMEIRLTKTVTWLVYLILSSIYQIFNSDSEILYFLDEFQGNMTTSGRDVFACYHETSSYVIRISLWVI